MRKVVAFLVTVFLFTLSVSAQDKIYRKNGQVVKAKVLEIGSEEIKYRLADSTETLVYVLEKDRITKIEFENGRVEQFTLNLKDPEQYAEQLRHGIKVNFIGPLIGFTQITYEKSLGVGKGYEVSLGIIGAGKNRLLDIYDNSLRETKRNQFGLSAGFGYKFSKLPDFVFGKTRFTHLMQGGYARPTVYLGNYSENRVVYKANNQYDVERQNITFGALQVELGKQWVFGDRMLLDTYWGFGYGFDNKKENEDSYYYNDNMNAYNYINQRLGRNPGFSLTGGIKVGLLLK
jgi:hypothetical protein